MDLVPWETAVVLCRAVASSSCELGSESLLVILLPVLVKYFLLVNVPLWTALAVSPVVLALQPFKVQNEVCDWGHFESSLLAVRKCTISSCSWCSKCCSSLLLVDFAVEKGSVMSSSPGETAAMQVSTHWPPKVRAACATCRILQRLLPSLMEFLLTAV